MSAPVALDGVSVRLGGTTILDHLSLDVAAGSWVSMIGPNGAGKTTVLRCITGAVPYQGTVQIGSAAVAEMQVREVARMVAIVPQHPTLPEGMRVVETGGRDTTSGLRVDPGAPDHGRVVGGAVDPSLCRGHRGRGYCGTAAARRLERGG